MPFTVLIYVLGASSAIFTLLATVLNGVCYVSSGYSLRKSRSIDSAFVSLSAISCSLLIILMALFRKEVRASREPWKPWKTGLLFFSVSFLLATAGVTAGGIAWSDSQLMRNYKLAASVGSESLFVARSVIWAFSLFGQGLFCGFLLIILKREEQSDAWPRPVSQDAEMRLDNSRSAPYSMPWLNRNSQPASFPTRPTTSSGKMVFRQSPTSDASSQISHCYSGLTLFQPDASGGSNALNNSADRPSSEPQTVRRTMSDDGSNRTRNTQKGHLRITSSLDNLILQALPEAPPSAKTEPARSDFRQEACKENDIHPLFRPSSPTPPPTPTFGTVVTASPAAGQTITTEALHRMKSSSMLSSNGTRSRSSTLDLLKAGDENEKRDHPEQTHEDPSSSVPPFILQASVRESQIRYEKTHDSSDSLSREVKL